MAQRIDTLFYELEARTSGLEQDLTAARESFDKFATFMTGRWTMVAAAIGVAVAGIATASSAAAVQFEAQMAKVQTVAKATDEDLKKLGDGVRRIFRELPVQDIGELTEGLYQILSSGIDASRGLEVLEVAAKAAIGGFTDVRTVADGLTSVLNAYKDRNYSAAEAADILAKAVANGKIEFAEIANSIGLVVGIASSFGTSLEDVSAVLAQLSLNGVRTAEGVTALRSAIVNIVRPSDDFIARFPKLAAEFDKTRLTRDGFVKFLLDFQRESNGSSEALAALFRDTQGYNGVVSLLKDNGDGLTKQFAAMGDAAGTMNEALDIVNATATAMWQTFKNNLGDALREVGEYLLPLVKGALIALNGAMDVFNGKLDAARVKEYFQALADAPVSSLRGGNIDAGIVKRAREAADEVVAGVRAGNIELEKMGTEALRVVAANLDAVSAQVGPKKAAEYRATAQAAREAAAAQEEAGVKAAQVAAREAELRKAKEKLDAQEAAAARALAALKEQREKQSAADRTAYQAQELGAALEDLFEKARKGEVTFREYDRGVDSLRGRFGLLKDTTREQEAAFAKLVQQAGSVRQALENIKARRLSEDFAAIIASLTTDALDDFAAKVPELTRALEAKNFKPEQIKEVIDLQRTLNDLQIESGKLQERIKLALDSNVTPMQKLSSLTQERQKLEAELVALGGDKSISAQEKRLSIAARLLQIDEAMAKVGDQNAGMLADMTDSAADLAGIMYNVLGSAVGIATALLGSENSITRGLSASLQLVSAYSRIAELAKAAGGFAKLLSTGAGIASALPALGAAVGAGAAVVSLIAPKETPEQRENREAIKKNTERLAELREGLGELTLTVSGAKVAAVRDVGLTSIGLNAGPVLGEGALTEVSRPMKDILRDLRAVGVGMEDLRKIAADFGITLSQSPTVAQLAQLQEAIRTFSLDKLLNTLGGQLKLLQLSARVNPSDFEGIKGVIEKIKVLTGAQGVPALATALNGLDLTTEEGRIAAIERLVTLFKNLKDVDLSQLGGLKADEFAEVIAELIESIRNAAPETKSAAEKFSDALELIRLQVEFGVLNTAQALAKAKDAFKSAFGDDVFGQIDFSSLDALKNSVKGIIEGFDDDGVLTDAEKALAAALRDLIGAFEDAEPAAERFTDAMDALEDEFEILGTDAAGRFAKIREQLTGQFAELFDLKDIDVSSAEGRAAFRERAEAIFASLQEGGVTEAEQKIIDAIKRMLGALGDVADEEAKAADEAARKEKERLDEIARETERIERERAERRRRIIRAGEAEIAANDIEDPLEQLLVRARALGKAFPELAAVMADFDLATEDGRAAFEAFVTSLLERPEDMEAMAMAMGISVDELIDILLGLEDGVDDVTAGIASAAARLGGAMDELQFGISLEGITDPLEKLTRTVSAIGGVLPEIDAAIAGFDLSSVEGRKSAEAALIALGKQSTDPTVRSAILNLLGQIRDLNASPGGGGGGAPAPGDEALQVANQALQQSAATSLPFNPQFNVLVDIQRRALSVLESILGAGALGPRIGALPPVGPNGTQMGALVINNVLNMHNTQVGDAADFGRQVLPMMAQMNDQSLAVRFNAQRALQGRTEIG